MKPPTFIRIVGRVARPKRNGNKGGWRKIALYRCQCGRRFRRVEGSGRPTQTCGCSRHAMKSHLIHGLTHTQEHNAWKAMRQRCYNPRNTYYQNYGGRGITVCKRWRDSFLAFFHDMGKRPPRRVLDRINPDGNYEPSNCRWADFHTQRVNRRRGARK